MKIIIGIDGGGTKARCIATDLNGNILFNTTGKSTNFLIHGLEQVCENILEVVNICCTSLDINYYDIETVMIGTAGAGRKRNAEKLENKFAEYCALKKITLKSFSAESDARIALEGAFNGGPGSILICGTGSIIYAKDENGNVLRSGGYGRLIGDEGSGFSIGRKALQAVSKSIDLRIPHTLLLDLMSRKFGIFTSDDLITAVYENNMDIASVAKLVLEAAQIGDKEAIKIINEEIEEILSLIESIYKKINSAHMKLSLLGGLVESDNIYSKTLKEKIIRSFSNIELCKPEFPPEMGAVLLARQTLNKKENS